MTPSRLRRGFAAFALTAAVSLLAAGPAQAARWRDSDEVQGRFVAARGLLQEVWTRLTKMVGAAGIVGDANGGR